MRSERYFLLGGIVMAIAAVFSTGFHHWDEHFQILEFAYWKLSHTPQGDLPWEFESRLRPAFQPFIVIVLYRALALFGTPDPFLLTLLLRLLTATLSFAGILLLVKGQLRDTKELAEPTLRRWFLFLSFFLWSTVYASVRFSSEGLSAALFLLGYALLVHGDRRIPISRYLATGLLLGLAIVVRYQMGLMVVGLLAWLLWIRKDRLWDLVLTGLGMAAMLGLGLLIDRWFYGEWTLTIWNYFEQNLLLGKAASFGTEPWWHYFEQVFTRAIPPFSLLFLVPPLLFFLFRWRHPLSWTILPFLLVHFAIGHKEIRFLFPLAALLPLVVILGIDVMRERWWPALLAQRWVRIVAGLFVALHLLILAVVLFKPADDHVALYKNIYRDYPDPITLVTDGQNPYQLVKEVHFYRRPGLRFQTGPDHGAPPIQGTYLFATRNNTAPNPSWGDARLIHSSIPEWLMRFNIGGWVERSNVWYVYEIRN